MEVPVLTANYEQQMKKLWIEYEHPLDSEDEGKIDWQSWKVKGESGR